MKILAGLLGGLILAVIAAVLVTFTLSNGTTGAIAFLAFWALGLAIALTAPSGSKAWRRLLITCAILSLLLPLSGLIYTGNYMATNIDPKAEYAGAQVAGAALGGGLLSGVLGFVGFFLGVVFLIIGLLVGRDKQVVYVRARESRA